MRQALPLVFMDISCYWRCGNESEACSGFSQMVLGGKTEMLSWDELQELWRNAHGSRGMGSCWQCPIPVGLEILPFQTRGGVGLLKCKCSGCFRMIRSCLSSCIHCSFPAGYDALSYPVGDGDKWSGRELLQAREQNNGSDVPEDGGQQLYIRNCTEPGRSESCLQLLSPAGGFLTSVQPRLACF